MIKKILLAILLLPTLLYAQINTERVMTIARNALYFEDYVLSIQYFNQVINAKPYLYEPYFFRALAKINLDDFQGAEMDCDLAIQRNPFVVGAYQIRGLARIRQDKFDGAIEDYKTALKYDPENVVLWHNLSLCHMQKEDFSSAKEDLGKLLAIAPRYTRAYLMRGEVNLKQNDTIQALKDFDTAIDMDRYDPDSWAARAIVRLQQADYKEAESDLDQAIHLSVRNSGNYINRALARFHQNNLRGAMSDYDLALDIDPNNFLGHYNRGLLRAQVGDDNRAIEDFDFVLKIEPDNMMATFNRGLLRAQTGDYRGAISDYSRVIDEYPNFMAGYYHRAEARKKIGDRKGAEQDEFKVMKMQLDKRNGVTSGGNGKDVADNNNGDSGQDSSKTRKKSDKNMENYRKIVIADDSEADQRYKSDYRGRVQDRNVTIKLEPMYALTYYEKLSDVKRIVHYHKYIDELNHSKLLPKPLRITNMESPLTEEQVRFHFALIDAHTSEIVADEKNAKKRFMRGLDFYLVQDFASSIDDFTQSILLDDTFFPAYFMRALVRYKQLEYKKAEAGMSEGAVSGTSEVKKAEVTAMDYDIVKNDLDHVIRLAPDFVYGYYNRGNILSMLKDYRAALVDYDKAIELNPDFAEAYFNRGLTHIFLGNNRQGISDLSKAGELGIVSAYNIIKRFTNTQQ
ncbi:tetratricopeptide repeat protein [Bacteroides eggerthii]|uniref:tetratricopeptide repeat protein n=1 Tax=Bacteroides eggerthii TaxID=28111 RepID=UPI001C24C00C|nr:tetratricopeptide repeat protein [Bacteroides eggerthii]MBU8972219.1 tetratricopeptide repeat protein [Bacteroides eggerthii]MBU8997019.1 tetratricopeptide repeat protein [Bacteroides eggerthii]MCG4758475.1 tetratricopeptide repeat protein [Bacteroides eggerthii]